MDDIVTWLRSILHNDRSVELHCKQAADEIVRLRHELSEAKKTILNLTVGTATHIMHERQDADSSNAEFRRNYR